MYTIGSITVGMFADKLPTGILTRIGVACTCLILVLLMFANSFWILCLVAGLAGGSGALYWTCSQNTVGKEAGEKLDSRIALYSISWSAGKSVGYISGGSLKGILGVTTSLICTIVLDGTQLIFLPFRTTFSKSEPSVVHKDDNADVALSNLNTHTLEKGNGFPESTPSNHSPIIMDTVLQIRDSDPSIMSKSLLENKTLPDPSVSRFRFAKHEPQPCDGSFLPMSWILNFTGKFATV